MLLGIVPLRPFWGRSLRASSSERAVRGAAPTRAAAQRTVASRGSHQRCTLHGPTCTRPLSCSNCIWSPTRPRPRRCRDPRAPRGPPGRHPPTRPPRTRGRGTRTTTHASEWRPAQRPCARARAANQHRGGEGGGTRTCCSPTSAGRTRAHARGVYESRCNLEQLATPPTTGNSRAHLGDRRGWQTGR